MWAGGRALRLYAGIAEHAESFIQNWTGTNGVLDIYAGEKLVLRFIEIDKLSTAAATVMAVRRDLTALAMAMLIRI